MKLWVSMLLTVALYVPLTAPVAQPPTQSGERVYASVNGKNITLQALEAAVHTEMRQRFYHGRVEEERLKRMRDEVGQRLIDQILLAEEVVRRKLQYDALAVDADVARELGQFNLAGVAEERRTQIKSMIREQVIEGRLIRKLRALILAVEPEADAVLLDFYRDNPDKFTTPEQLSLSVILLKVAPSAPVPVWEAAHKEAEQLLGRLAGGADFAALAQLHSGDASAAEGGALGFVHRGMLSVEAQGAVDVLASGEVSKPVPLLQGVALFKLHERREARLNRYEQVAQRVRALWVREEGERRWQELLVRLRGQANIVMR